MQFVNVVVDNKSKQTDAFYTYKAPDKVKVGQRVKVPFNVHNTIKDAYVVQCNVKPEFEADKIKEITEIDNLSLNEEMINTAIWMKRRYGVKYIDGIKCFVPKGKTVIKDETKAVLRGKEEISCTEKNEDIQLTEEQEKAINQINDSIENDKEDIYLLHGVTSSGKTEVYIQTVAKALECGKTAIVLVPEIALTSQTLDRFIKRFGIDKIALLHSKLTTKERFDQWEKLRSGKAKIAIGARVGVFAPLENIGVIIMDEEHESTYKSDMSPKFDTIDVALKRARYYKGTLVMGSATPSIVSYERAKEGIFKLLTLKKRFNETPLPHVEIVDMREELRSGNKTILSNELFNKMKKTLQDKKQIILFLNRRGYANYVSCRSCGETIMCEDCNISMTYHKSKNALICHYCGKKIPMPKVCPKCGSKYIKQFGIGTEQLEEKLREFFPEATIDRLDLDTGTKKSDIDRILGKFGKKKTDILVGTQLVAKGLDFDNVGLVGVVMADVSLNIPDYRASERTFQLITQVSGRAGRGKEKGEVVVQTYTPEHFAILTASNHAYEEFFQHESALREKMNYPPYTDLIVVNFTSKDKNLANQWANDFVNYIKGASQGLFANNTYSPKEAFGFKGDNAYRCFVLIKSPKGKRDVCVYHINNYMENLAEKRLDCHITIDINPYGNI